MKNKLLLFLIILLIANIVNGQNLKKGQKKINKKDFSGAVEFFNKILTDNPSDPGAYYGLALVYSDSLNNDKDLFTAIYYINLSKKHFLNLDDGSKEKISSELNETKINQKLSLIDDELYKYVVDKSDTTLINSFLKNFSFSKHYYQATHLRNKIIFNSVLAENTIEGYQSFIKKYPDAVELEQALKLRNQLAFVHVKDSNTIEMYNEFIKKYPDASEINEALKYRNILAFEVVLETNTIEAYEAFIKDCPMAEQKNEVIKLRNKKAFDLALMVNTITSFQEFKKKYPNAEQCTQANEKINELNKWKCIPGIKVGEIVYNTSEKNLREKYGEYNIMRDSVKINNKNYYGTFLFSSSPEKKLFIIWKNRDEFANPERIIIYGNKWQTHKGVKIGTTIEELILYNKKDIEIFGFSREREGVVRSWNEGELSVLHRLNNNFYLRMSYDVNKFYNIPEKGLLLLTSSESISSDNEYVKMINLKVDYMEISFPGK